MAPAQSNVRNKKVSPASRDAVNKMPNRKLLMRQAAEACYEEMPTDHNGIKQCPWCGWQGTFGNDEDRKPFQRHLKEHHPVALTLYYTHPEHGFDAVREVGKEMVKEEDDDFVPFPDQVDVTDWEDFDMLEIPQVIRDRYKNKGGQFRFCTDERVQFYKDRGGMLPERITDDDGPRQGDHSDLRFRMNEMTLMYFPEPVAVKFAEAKRRKIKSQGDLKGSAEANEKGMGDIGEKAYEYFRKRNISHENAMKLAAKSEASHNNEAPDRLEAGEQRYVHMR